MSLCHDHTVVAFKVQSRPESGDVMMFTCTKPLGKCILCLNVVVFSGLGFVWSLAECHCEALLSPESAFSIAVEGHTYFIVSL